MRGARAGDRRQVFEHDLRARRATPCRGGCVASSALISSSGMRRPSSRSTSSILPGCSRHFVTMSFSGIGSTPISDAMMMRSSLGDEIARRAQAVAVERRADLAAVGEGDRGRAVPRLHQRGVDIRRRRAAPRPSAGCRPRLPGSASSWRAPANSRPAPGIRARCRSRRCRTGLRRRSATAW